MLLQLRRILRFLWIQPIIFGALFLPIGIAVVMHYQRLWCVQGGNHDCFGAQFSPASPAFTLYLLYARLLYGCEGVARIVFGTETRSVRILSLGLLVVFLYLLSWVIYGIGRWVAANVSRMRARGTTDQLH